jgi:outer membrane protein assembly factor BamB
MLSYAGKVRTHGNDYYVLKYPSLVSVSDNGKYVIAASIFKCALAWFSRNPINGELTFGGELIDSGPTVFGIYEISEFKVFAGGTRIFTAAGVSSGLFSVDTNSGKLTWLESVVIPTFPNQFHSGTSVAICGDNIYTTGYDGTLTILKWTPNTTNLKSFSTHKNVNPGLRTGCLSDLLGRKAKQQITHSRSDLVMASHGSLYSRWITKRK